MAMIPSKQVLIDFLPDYAMIEKDEFRATKAELDALLGD
jgi:hypothetical protein